MVRELPAALRPCALSDGSRRAIFAEVIALARSLIEDALETSRTTGYLHFEGLGCWLMRECLAPESPAMAEPYLKTAIAVLERIGARNDLALGR